METKRSLRSRVALIRITLKQLVSDQPTNIKPFKAQPSPFLQLPQELRDQIYCYALGSIRVSFGRRGNSAMKPAPHALALLRVCRQMHQEARALWLEHVLFSFEDPYSLLDKLSSIPPNTLSQIRNIRTGGRALFLCPGTFVHRREYYSHVWALKFLPELSLDRLTVLGVPDGRENYNFLDELIKYGHGWKELYFYAQDSKLFGFARVSMNVSTGVPLQRKPQPSNWNGILRQRDGADSQCSVTIYRSEDAPAPGSVVKPQILDPQKRWTFEQSPAPDELGSFGIEEDEQLMADGEVGKEILVVVKRGRTADIRGLDTPPYKNADMRQWANGKAWRKIKKEWTMPAAKWVAKRIETDSYMDVDDFTWSSFEKSPTSP